MDSKNKEDKIWVDKLRLDIQTEDIDEALDNRGLRAEEIRLLPKGRAVLVFAQKSVATACLKERDVFRNLGCNQDSWAHLMKYQTGFEDSMFRGQDNLIEERLGKDIYDLFTQSHDNLTSLTEQHKITWFYSTSQGLYLRGPAAAVKQASSYLNNNVAHRVCDESESHPARRALVLQPDGTMVAQVKKKKCLPGYPNNGTIIVTYDFPPGVQGENHPRPGRLYNTYNVITYVPDSDEGRMVVRLLKKAFDQKLLFLIMWSTDKDKVVMQDCVRHKTKVNGGVEQNAYPDSDYLAAVKNDLAAIGIK